MYRIIYADDAGTTIDNLTRKEAIRYAKACLLAHVDFSVLELGNLFNWWKHIDVTSEIANAAREAM